MVRMAAVAAGLALAGAAWGAAPAAAQYYDGYQGGYRGDPYYRPPPPRYYEPPPRRVAFGTRCEAAIPSGYGARPLICPIVRDRPLGRPCVCPAPPRFGGGSFEGRVIP